jgi:hypothetical protein
MRIIHIYIHTYLARVARNAQLPLLDRLVPAGEERAPIRCHRKASYKARMSVRSPDALAHIHVPYPHLAVAGSREELDQAPFAES